VFALYSEHPDVNPYAKIAKVTEVLEDHLSIAYVTCRQLALLFDLLPQGKLWRYEASKEQFYQFGSYRVELLITLLCRITDMHNFEVVMNALEPEEIGVLVGRVGYYNGLFNPMKPEGYYMFNIGRHVEDRQFVKFFIILGAVEPGANWVCIKDNFRWSMHDEWIPGWECPSSWMTESGLTNKGIVRFAYASGPGGVPHVPGDGFEPTIDCRKAFCYMVCAYVHVPFCALSWLDSHSAYCSPPLLLAHVDNP
jgi:hypothetical protein